MASPPKKKAPSFFETSDPSAAFDHFGPLVADIPETDLDVWNADPEIVRVNARRAVDAVSPHWEQVEKALPLVSLASLKEIPSLALALSFAAGRVHTPASPQEIRAHQASLRPARRLALDQLDIFGEMGLVPKDVVRTIRTGTGAVDEANDAVAIVALFKENAAAFKHKHPFDDAFLQKLADDGHWLLGQLVPKGAKPEKAVRSAEVLMRDRLWTELNRRYDDLYKAGVEVWGRRKVEEHLPSLFSRQSSRAGHEKIAAQEPSPAEGT
jgi:hypothetical protein